MEVSRDCCRTPRLDQGRCVEPSRSPFDSFDELRTSGSRWRRSRTVLFSLWATLAMTMAISCMKLACLLKCRHKQAAMLSLSKHERVCSASDSFDGIRKDGSRWRRGLTVLLTLRTAFRETQCKPFSIPSLRGVSTTKQSLPPLSRDCFGSPRRPSQ